jgi:hypothetical protein
MAATSPNVTPRQRFSAECLLARRRASLDLDRLVGCYPYPNPHEVYGMTTALARMLDAEAVAA